jgi:superfamily II DNA or RNA helicase
MATAVGPLTSDERRALHFAPKGLVPSPPVVCYEREGQSYVFPRFAQTAGARRAEPEAPRAELTFAGELRTEQKLIADALESAIAARGAALCELPTGAGKTVIALALAARLGVRTLVVVHTRVLHEQWLSRVATFLAPGAVDVGMLQTLCRRAPAEPYGLVVYDEVHHLCARSFSRVMLKVRPRYALGLSATVTRADGLQSVLHAFFGEPSSRERARGRVARVECVPVPDFGVVQTTAFNRALGRSCVVVSRLVSDLAACAPRTALLAEKCAALCSTGRRVLVLSHRRRHCTELHAALVARGFRAALVLGGGKTQVLEGHDAVVGTVAAVSEGFDEPWLDTLVFATPLVGVTQAVGRVLRRDHAALVVDPVDLAIPTCRAQHRRRCAAYRAAGHALEERSDRSDRLARPHEAERLAASDVEGDDGA